MRFDCALFRHSEADDRLDADKFRFVFDLLRVSDRVLDRLDVVAVLDLRNMPADRLETLRHVLAKREIGRAVDRDLVVVVEIDQIIELADAPPAKPIRN